MKLSYKYNDKTFREFCQIKFGYCSLVVSNITSLEIRQRKNINVNWYFYTKAKLFAFCNLWRQWKIEPGRGLAKVDRLIEWATKAEISCLIILFYIYCIHWICTYKSHYGDIWLSNNDISIYSFYTDNFHLVPSVAFEINLPWIHWILFSVPSWLILMN